MIIFCQNSEVWPNWLGLTGNRATERKEATKSNSGKNSKLTRKCVQEPFSSNLVDWTNKGAVSLTAKYIKEECHSEPVRTLAHPRVASLVLRTIHLLGIRIPCVSKAVCVPLTRKRPFGSCRSTSDMENGLPHQWCSAQRIKISMIAGGNHTLIQCGLVRNDIIFSLFCL